MNCPHHHKLFAAVPRSYRDLPLRLAEYGTCYRYEQSGELFGLMRVRSLQMNDAHIYCTPEQFEAEFNAVNEMYLKYFKLFGIDKYLMRFSTHDPARLGQKFVDEPELWKQTEEMVRVRSQIVGNQLCRSLEPGRVLRAEDRRAGRGAPLAANYQSRPTRSISRSRAGSTCATRTATTPTKTPICIHRAPLGTHERFIGFLIEHYAGNFPLWLAPEQIRILPIGDEPPLIDYSRAILNELRAQQVRAGIDLSHRQDQRQDPACRANESAHHAGHRKTRHGRERRERARSRPGESRRKAARSGSRRNLAVDQRAAVLSRTRDGPQDDNKV